MRITLPAFSRHDKLELEFDDVDTNLAFHNGLHAWFFNDQINKPFVTKIRMNDFALVGRNALDRDDRSIYCAIPDWPKKVIYSYPVAAYFLPSDVQQVKYDIDFPDYSAPTLQAYIHISPESSYGYLPKWEWISQVEAGLTPNSTYLYEAP